MKTTAKRVDAGTVEEHNGWKNYETWVTHLWVSEDEALYEWFLARARRYLSEASAESKPEAAAQQRLAEALKGLLTRQAYGSVPTPSGLAFDLLRHAFERVDWNEIAEAFLEVVR